MSISCLFSARLCAALETVLWSLIVEIKFLEVQHTYTYLNVIFKFLFANLYIYVYLEYILSNSQLEITISK